MKEMAWYNGNYCSPGEVAIPLEDRGYLFGDGVYEVIRVYNSKPFYLKEHYERLNRSSKAISIEVPFSLEGLEAIISELLIRSSCCDAYIYIQVTRGSALRNHLAPPDIQPMSVIYVRELSLPPILDEIKPVKCVTVTDDRWLNCHIKSTSLLPNILARQKANQNGAVEAIYYRQNNIVTEGSRSSVFAVIDGQVRTHPESNLILSGITRKIVIDLMAREGINYLEKSFTLDELKTASEVWITSTTMEINPVGSIDQFKINNGEKGDLFYSMAGFFKNLIRTNCYMS